MTKVNELVIGGLNDAVARIAVAAAEASGLGTGRLPVNVALLLRDQGKLGAARALLERVVEAREAAEAAGEGAAAATLEAKGWLGGVMQMQGEWKAARGVLGAAAEGLEAELGAEDERTLVAKGSLAVVMAKEGDLAGARALYVAVLKAQGAAGRRASGRA